MKVLIIKLGALGDIINTFPLTVTIKQGVNVRTHWLVAPLSRPLVKEHGCVTNLWVALSIRPMLPKIQQLNAIMLLAFFTLQCIPDCLNHSYQ